MLKEIRKIHSEYILKLFENRILLALSKYEIGTLFDHFGSVARLTAAIEIIEQQSPVFRDLLKFRILLSSGVVGPEIRRMQFFTAVRFRRVPWSFLPRYARQKFRTRRSINLAHCKFAARVCRVHEKHNPLKSCGLLSGIHQSFYPSRIINPGSREMSKQILLSDTS